MESSNSSSRKGKLEMAQSKLNCSIDSFCWLCPHCHGIFHESRAEISDVEKDIERILQDFENRKTLFYCASCGQN